MKPTPGRSAAGGGPTAGSVPLAAVVSLFVLSGASGLIYEVIWIRSLTLVFGNTVQAASAVLCAFMAGLAAGSALGGRLVDRTRASALTVYAMLEAGIGVWALLLPLVDRGLMAIYIAFSAPFDQLPAAVSAARFVLATSALIPATALMGATLPALSRWAVRREAEVGGRLGLLYALNTLGGVLGCLAAGFVLIEALGLRGTTWSAAASNFLVAGLAFMMGRRGPVEAGAPASEAAVGSDAPRSRGLLVMAAVCLGGFGALALEVIWTRALLLVFGSTTYSSSAMLAVFLFGIGAGSLIMTPFADRLRHPWIVLGLVQGGIGVAVLASAHAVDLLPELYLRVLAWRGLSWPHEMEAKFLISIVLMLVPTILSGAVWPLAVRLARPAQASLGAQVGRLYAANTVGSIAGALAGAFLLLPRLGMEYSLAAIAVLFAAFGAAALMADQAPAARRAAAALGLVVAAGLLSWTLRPWDRRALTSGAYFMPKLYLDHEGRSVLGKRLKEQKVIYYAEGVTTTPSVALLADVNKAFFNDGKIEGGTALDGMRLQRLLGHLPLLLHRGEPATAFNLGLGSGITLGAMGVHPVPRIDCAEIEPAVVGAARQFDEETFKILDRPGLRMIYNDGRNHLMLTRERYDAMSSMPTAPLFAGATSLFSLEHFRLVRSRLAPGGMISQWVPLYQLSQDDFLGLIKTFATVFPDATVWFTGIETILLAGDGAQSFDFGTLSERMRDPKVAESLRQMGFDDPMRLLATYCFRVSDVADDLKSARLNTDDRPRVEFSAPRSHLVNTVGENLAWILSRRRSPAPFIHLPDSWPDGDDRRRQLMGRLEVMLDAQRLTMEGRLRVLRGDLEGGIATLEQAIAADSSDPYARDLASRNISKLAERLYDAGKTAEAIASYERALTWDPRNYFALYNLARLEYDRGDVQRARQHTVDALAMAPHSPSLNYRMGVLLFNDGRGAAAERFLRTALDLDPQYPDPLMVLGDLYHQRGDHASAAGMFAQAIALGKNDAEAHAAWAGEALDQGDRQEASRRIEAALALAPSDPEALFTRARIGAASGQPEQARRDLRAALAAGARFRNRAMADPALRSLLEAEASDVEKH